MLLLGLTNLALGYILKTVSRFYGHEMKNTRRVLLDLDGTLFDTQDFHAEAEAVLMKAHGVHIDPLELSRKYAGRPTEQVFMEVLGCDFVTGEKLAKLKWEIIFPKAVEAKELCDLFLLFTRIKQEGIALSIGTASPVYWARELLRLNNLEQFFDDGSVIGGDMVKRGKPHPDIWLKAARDTLPEHCLVIEDGTAGIDGATAAGMRSALLLPRKHVRAYPINDLWDILHLL